MTRERARAPIRSVRRTDGTCLVEVAGDVTLDRSLQFQRDLMSLVGRCPERVVVDLSGVPHMDSTGVASLVKLLARVKRAGAKLVLVGLTPRVRSMFEVTRLDTVFDIRTDVNEALT